MCAKPKPDGKLQSIYCHVKHIGRTNLKVDIHANLTKLIDDMWFHLLVYYKFNGIVYNKYTIDLWENIVIFWMEKEKEH